MGMTSLHIGGITERLTGCSRFRPRLRIHQSYNVEGNCSVTDQFNFTCFVVAPTIKSSRTISNKLPQIWTMVDSGLTMPLNTVLIKRSCIHSLAGSISIIRRHITAGNIKS
jgi:hypothetical protein